MTEKEYTIAGLQPVTSTGDTTDSGTLSLSVFGLPQENQKAPARLESIANKPGEQQKTSPRYAGWLQ